MSLVGRPNTTLPKSSSHFTDKQKVLIKALAEGKSAKTAMIVAGYSVSGTNWKLIQDPDIQAEVQRQQRVNEQKSDMSRKRVMDGILEAIEQAKLLAEPMTQIAGWRELAKMCGYYAPEIKTVNVNVTAQRMIGQLEALSDAELLEMIEQDGDMLEGEAREILELPHDGSDKFEHTSAPA